MPKSPIIPRDVAAVVVLYRPAPGVVTNARALAAQVDHVYAIDNTETPDDGFVEELKAIPSLTYAPLGDNLGIAVALNDGVRRAQAAGYPWVLTMDQDSTPTPAMVGTLARCAASRDTGGPVGIASPVQVQAGSEPSTPLPACSSELTVMTSGNLLNVEAWRAVGGFDEGLFIDQVDHDICLRMHRSGFAVLRCGKAILVHRMGENVVRHVVRDFDVSNHAALRRYYITRNRFEVVRRYRADFPEFAKREMKALRRELVKIALYEKDKRAKLRMSWRGYRDFKRGVTGRYPEQGDGS